MKYNDKKVQQSINIANRLRVQVGVCEKRMAVNRQENRS